MPNRTRFANHLRHDSNFSNHPIPLFNRLFGRKEPEHGRIKRREIKPLDAAAIAMVKNGGTHAGA